MDDLHSKILQAKDLYYKGCSTLSDEEYDKLEEEWRILNPETGLQVDAGQCSNVFSQPYLSLRKGKFDDVVRFIGSSDYVITPKIDGVSMEIRIHNNGTLEAYTRGGVCVTDSFVTFVEPFWENVKALNQQLIILRGEVFFKKNQLKDIQALGFSNLRNAVAGLLNRKTIENIPNLPKMGFEAWRLVNPPKDLLTHTDSLNLLRDLGYPVVEDLGYKLFEIENFENKPESSAHFRDNYSTELDGLVVFKDSFSDWVSDIDKDVYQNAIAWKFVSPKGATLIRAINWSLGTTGLMTPVAVVDPVSIGGVVVTNVNLHNHENLQKLNAYPGCEAIVERSGDVIPSIKTFCRNSGISDTNIYPKTCPVCESNLVVGKNTIRCVNTICDNKITGVVEKWVLNHDWKFFSSEAIKSTLPFFKNTHKHPIVRLYDVTESVLHDYMTEGLATRLWENYKTAVNNTKPETLLGSLNVDLVGVRNAKEVLSKVSNILILPNYLSERVASGKNYVYEKNLLDWILENYETFQHIVNLVNKLGLDNNKTNLSSKGRVVITGELPGCTREEAFTVISSSGYEPSNSLTKTTSFLITQFPDSNTTKLQKAKKYGVKIVTWEDFLALL